MPFALRRISSLSDLVVEVFNVLPPRSTILYSKPERSDSIKITPLYDQTFTPEAGIISETGVGTFSFTVTFNSVESPL